MLAWGSASLHPRLYAFACSAGCSQLREYPSHSRSFGNSIDRQNVRASSQVNAIMLRLVVHLVERVAHRVFQGLVDARLTPEERILILHPLVIANGYAARVREDVGNQQ